MSQLSAHFSSGEFTCPCCGRVKTSAALVARLERLRADHYRTGLRIVSGYRCPRYNAVVGGKSASRHLFGDAADIPGRVSLAVAKALGFKGIGVEPHGLVVHVDMRPGPVTVWYYDANGHTA
jgi:uncharacterized protein YcbK (DUF882 family)